MEESGRGLFEGFTQTWLEEQKKNTSNLTQDSRPWDGIMPQDISNTKQFY
jgi:hypothetical protein